MVPMEGLVDGKGISDVVAVGYELTRNICARTSYLVRSSSIDC